MAKTEQYDNLSDYAALAQKQAEAALDWARHLTFSGQMAGESLAIAVIAALAWYFSEPSAVWLETRLKPRGNGWAPVRLHASYRELFFLIYSSAALWCVVMVAAGLSTPLAIIHTTASLVAAWGVIRLTSGTIRNIFWSRLIAFFLWGMVALSIMGWLDRVVGILHKATFSIGDFKLSLLVMVKSVIAFGVLLWAVRIISGFLDHAFSKTDGLTPSQRVLFQKVSNITLYAVAVVIGFNIAGVNLTALTVFSGALGFGIGFGLQKVFSNLISGMILLLDKSVKPGDVISVGQTFGWVNSLGARYVSVLTREGKEHLIPNETLITQEVENWSYSDNKVRVAVPVGVSYGADIHKVKELLLQAVAEHPRVLKYPAPVCLISGFGDNSVDHSLLVWITDPTNGIQNLKSDIYYRVWDLFRENGVEIPFPQRDVHIKAEQWLQDALRAAKQA
ncbi:MAG: mechanosensitive ion channel [Alphaproteobacteria bacterium]|nr:mechanosensitive ion channel [Alphaproteobacteria bacterium]